MSELVGWAQRAKFHDARRAFEAGATVIVTEQDEGPEHAVWSTSTTHDRERTTWAYLAEQVKTWRNRYPGQRFYVLPETDSPAEPAPASVAELLGWYPGPADDQPAPLAPGEVRPVPGGVQVSRIAYRCPECKREWTVDDDPNEFQFGHDCES